MEFFKKQTTIKFMQIRKITGVISATLFIFSLIVLLQQGLNYGLEFTGGTQIELRSQQPLSPALIKTKFEEVGFKDLRVQNYGSANESLIRLIDGYDNEASLRRKVNDIFQANGQQVDIRRIEFVGSEVGEELAQQGGVAVLAAILSTMVYITLRFEYRFAVSAALSLVHDVIILLGIFSFFKIEFDLATLAAVLAVLGYSLNDTIVIFDRVRENFRKIRKEPTDFVINLSINQTLSRTIMTSFLTLLVVIALLVFGGKSLYGFSLALFLGIVIGTYSSIYVAGSLALAFGLSREDLLPKPKVENDDLP